jgi:Zn-dependent M28 family amino/carboxypeptidase
LGAWAWADNPPWPLEKTVAMLNMDMIGRSEEVPEGGGGRFRGLAVQTAASNANAINVIGTSFSPDLRAVVTAANSNFDLQLRFRYDNNPSNLLRRSDHWVFLNHGIPALWFHTGLHPDYHTIYDRPETIDYPKMERIARLVHQLGWDLAQGGQRPAILKPRPIPEPD